jgi:signal transduction histidine kinase
VVSIPNEELIVRCDPLRIEQVVSNLVSNAIKYSTDQVEITVLRCDSWATIEVKDHGVGMSRDDRSRLFEPFRRVALSKESIPGVGLGLFVVRELVRAHRGYLEVESELHVGSTFRVHLPLAPDAENNEALDLPESAPR